MNIMINSIVIRKHGQSIIIQIIRDTQKLQLNMMNVGRHKSGSDKVRRKRCIGDGARHPSSEGIAIHSSGGTGNEMWVLGLDEQNCLYMFMSEHYRG